MASTDKIKVKDTINCTVFSCEEIYGEKPEVSMLKHTNRFKVCLAVGGSGILRVLDQEIPCSKGDICIIPPNVFHCFFLSDLNDSLTIRQIEFDIMDWFSGDAATKGSPDYCYGVLNYDRIVAYATLNSYMQERMERLYDYIEAELLEQSQGWQELVSGYLANLFVNIARYINSAIKNRFFVSKKEWDMVSDTMHVVAEQYGDSSLTLSRIASDFYISQSQLSRIFKKSTGMAFSDYLRGVRINKVCELLKKSDLNVDEIAKKCGFRDMNTFYKSYQNAIGMTPKKYRQSFNLSDKITERNISTLKEEKIMVILSDISENLQKGKAKMVKELVQQAIDEGSNPEEILNEGLLAGMSVIGEKFKNNEIYVPEVLVAARAMNMGAQVLKPHLAANGVQAVGKVCIGTVQGDLHDIGKNLVKMMMEGKGLEVIDLGTDVAPETFVQTAIEQNCQVICCSALLTTTMGVMADVVKAAEAAGIRDKVKIMIGGAPVNEDYCKEIGADCYTVDAASAADAAVAFCK